MIEIEWTTPAFAQLEVLPEVIAFEIVRRVDMLASFPEMGVSLRDRYPRLANCRQLVVKRFHRVIYRYDQANQTIQVLAVQRCRQQLPSTSELRRASEKRSDEDE